jgi:PAS domain S-box-containing protein
MELVIQPPVGVADPAMQQPLPPPSPVSLSAEAPPIRSGCEYDYPPFCMVHADGRVDGFSVELFRAALRAMGREADFRVGPWAEVKGWLERGEVDALPLVGRTPEREAVFDFTFPYMSLHGAIAVHADTKNIRSLGDLRGRRVAVTKGDNAEEFLRREERGIEIHTTPTFEEALRELSEGRHDAVVMQRLVALRLLQETGLKNLRILDEPVEGFRQDFSFAVKKGDSKTLALLNEGLSLVMADGTYRHLHAKWFAALELPSNRRIVVGGDHNYPPFESLNSSGRPVGYTVDITRAIAREMGLDIEIRLGPWSEIVHGLETGEIDVVQGMFYSPTRDLKFDFSPAHLVKYYVSVVRKGEMSPPNSLAGLKGKRIVIQRGDMIHDFLEENGLGDQLSFVETQEDVLRSVAEGKVECGLAVRRSALVLIGQNQWTRLALGRRPIFEAEYCYAVRNDQKALLARFGEGLKVVEETGEYRRIYKKWLGVYDERPIRPVVILRYVATGAVPILLLLLGVFLWSRSLRKQVARRTEELRRSEEMLRQSEEKHRLLYEYAPLPYQSLDQEGRMVDVNPAWLRALGYERSEVLGSRFVNYLDSESKEKFIGNYAEYQRLGNIGEVELTMIRKDGGLINVAFDIATPSPPQLNMGHVYCVFKDITEQKRVEEALQNVHALYRDAITQADAVPYLRDFVSGTYLFIGEAITKLTGYSPEEFVPELWKKMQLDIIMRGEADGLSYAEASRRAFSGELTKWNADYLIQTHSGEKRWVADSSVYTRDAQGRLLRSLGILQDITERRNNEVALQKQHERTTLLNRVARATTESNAPEEMADALLAIIRQVMPCDAYYIDAFDATQLVAHGIRSYDTMNGVLQSFPTHTVSVFPEGAVDSVVRFQRKSLRILRDKEPEKGMELAVFGNTSRRSASLLYAPLVSRDRVVGSISVQSYAYNAYSENDEALLFEIALQAGPALESILLYSETKRAEESLRKAHEIYRAAIAQAEAVPYQTDFMNNRYVFMGEGIETLTGYCATEFQPDRWSKITEENILLGETAGLTLEQAGALMRAGKINKWRSDLRIRSRQGEIRWLADYAVAILDETGVPVGSLGILQDITDRKRAEEERVAMQSQLTQAQKMESIGRLAGGVAHDFNNILQSILGYSQLLLDSLPPKEPTFEYADEILHEANRAAALTRQLLAFARKQTYLPRALDINDTIAGLLKMLKRLIGEDIDLLWKPGKETWMVKMDPSQVDQILANLVVNARDSIEGVGKIILETDNVEIDENYCADHLGFLPGQYVMIGVSDDGVGIDKETLAWIFEPFFTTKELGKGTGLGLPTVYGIVKQNNGFINVYSEPGGGATFHIYLPRHVGEEAPREEPRDSIALTTGTETILLVEDDGSLLSLATQLLVQLGYTVLPADAPALALELARSHADPIDLLMTDVVMPGMNGRDLWRQLSVLRPGLKCLFMSGYTANVIAHRGVLEDDVHFLQKPFSREALAVKLREVLEE